MTDWLLIIIFITGYKGGVSTERIATHDECIAIGNDWMQSMGTGIFNMGEYQCIPIQPLVSKESEQ